MTLRARRTDRDGIFSGNKAERAIIDIGSNTVRMVIYGGSPRAPTILFNEKVTAQLGRDIARTGRLADDAIDLAMRGLNRYALLLRDLGVEDIETVATAASRDAENGAEFIEQVVALGLNPRVISGEQEAEISAAGVLGAFPGARGVVADLGGGSLELVNVADGKCGTPTSMRLGTLRLPDFRGSDLAAMKAKLVSELGKNGWGKAIDAPLYLVGGTWRAIAVVAMEGRDYPLTDPHGFRLSDKGAMKLARKIANSQPEDLRGSPRVSTMRSEIMPDAAVLLQALLKALKPKDVIFSSWGLREGLLFSRLSSHAKSQDPLLAGLANFAAQRGAPPVLATRVAGWTSEAVPSQRQGSERLRLAASMLSLASMQTEPNLRVHQAVDWALHKRWISLSPDGRAMLAAAACANGNHLTLPVELMKLASEDALEEAICWGLATRLARRLGGKSRRSLQVSRLTRDAGQLTLHLQHSHRHLFGVPNEKDMLLLSARLGTDFDVRIVPDDELLWDDDAVAG